MAVWHFNYRGIKVHGEDKFELPITEKVTFAYKYEGKNETSAWKYGREEAKQWPKENNIGGELGLVEQVDSLAIRPRSMNEVCNLQLPVNWAYSQACVPA